jgi:hypothetical protein
MMRRALGLILGALVGAGIRAAMVISPAEDAVLPHALECARPRLRGPELSASSRMASAMRASKMSGRFSTSAPRVRSTTPSCDRVVNSRVTCSRRQPMRAAIT